MARLSHSDAVIVDYTMKIWADKVNGPAVCFIPVDVLRQVGLRFLDLLDRQTPAGAVAYCPACQMESRFANCERQWETCPIKFHAHMDGETPVQIEKKKK